jgi:predicted transcriptional regulator
LAFDWTNQVITSKENDDTKFIKLKFTENGLGKNGQKFFMTKRENKCVVCGETESLHKTYIVPKEFRDHMPESYKLHNDYDLTLMCTKHHNIFSQLLQKQKNDFIKKSGFKDEIEHLPNQLKEVKKAARIIFKENVPESIKLEKLKFIDSILKTNLVDRRRVEIELCNNNFVEGTRWEHYLSELSVIENLPDFCKPKNYKSIPQKIVDRFDGSKKKLNDFIISWRIFFTMSMLPKFLPEYWTPYDNLINY